jgi:signal transduction histidine kinase
MSAYFILPDCLLFAFWANSLLFGVWHLIGGLTISFLVLLILFIFSILRNKHLKKELAYCGDKLYEAQKANQSKDKLFSIVAHDLRSPFNSLMGLSEMLMLQAESMHIDQVQYYSKLVHSSTSTLYTLVDDLLQWARTQTGNTTYHPEKLDLNILTANIVNLSRISAQEKDIVIALKMENQLEAMADAQIFSTVLRNLINNAIKFSKVGCTIQVNGVKRDDGVIEISVADRGVGMNSEQLEDVFKIDGSRSTSGTFNEPGTGLGLVLCKEFVEINNGEIEVDSQEGHGTTVKFTVPSIDLIKK